MSSYTVVSGGGSPVTVAEFKEFAAISHTEDDDLITNFILPAATQVLEKLLNRAFVTQTVDYFTDKFSERMTLPLSPATTVTHIKYYATSGTLTTVDSDSYIKSAGVNPSTIGKAYGVDYPTDSDERIDGINIQYIAGVAIGDVDEQIKMAVKLFASHYFEHRGLVSYGGASIEVPRTLALFVEPLKVRYLV